MDTTIARTVDARGSFCPGPLMELIRAIKEAEVGDAIAVWSADKGPQDIRVERPSATPVQSRP